MADIPAMIRIGPFDFRVRLCTRKEAESRAALGWIEKNDLEIIIQEGLPPMRTAEVVLHEVFHGVWEVASFGDCEKEEIVVTGFGVNFLQVLRDNPDLLAFFEDAFKRAK